MNIVHMKKQVWRDIFMLHGFNSFHTTQPDHRVVALPAMVKNSSVMNTHMTGASTNPKKLIFKADFLCLGQVQKPLWDLSM